MFCGKCGASVPDGERTCPFCGEEAVGGALAVTDTPKPCKRRNRRIGIVVIAAAALLLIVLLVLIIASCTAVDPESIAKDAVEAYMGGDAEDYCELYDEDYLRRYYEYNYNDYLELCEKRNVKSDWKDFDDFYDDLIDEREDYFVSSTRPDKEAIADRLDSKYTEIDYEIDDDSIVIKELGRKALAEWQERFDLVNFHGELTEGVKLSMTVSFISADGDQHYDVKMSFVVLKVNDNWCLFRCNELYRAQDCSFLLYG